MSHPSHHDRLQPTSPLRVRMVAHDFGRGGAARAATRVADALSGRGAELGIELSLRSVTGPGHPLGDVAPYPGGMSRAVRSVSVVRRRLADRLAWTPATEELHSRADIWTGIGHELNRAEVDVVNLHWMGTGTLAIEEIGRLRHPVVLSLHDMWAFSGAEHYTYDERFIGGYSKATRPSGEDGTDWNRHTWRRKARSWRRPMHVVVPSRWLGDCAGRSALMRDWPISVIPYALNVDFWRPVERGRARSSLGLPRDSLLILTGADGGMGRHVKGGDLLARALDHLARSRQVDDRSERPIELVMFGGPEPRREPRGRLPFAVHELGNITDDVTLRDIYSACDLMVVPSRLEALGQTASEAQACGTPVVTFDVAGLRDVVEDGVSGRRAEPYDPESLAAAVDWVLADESRRRALGTAGRSLMKNRFNPARIAQAYADVFHAAHRASRIGGS